MTHRSCLGPIVGMLLLAGCPRGGPTPPAAAAAAAPAKPAQPEAPKTPEDIQKLLETGGKSWSSPAELSARGETWTAGTRFWIWPAGDDATVVMKDRKLRLPFHWRLRPGETPPDKDGEDGSFVFLDGFATDAPSGQVMTGGGQRVDLAVGANEGTFEYVFDLAKERVEGEGFVAFRLGMLKPNCNLIKIRVRFENP